VYAGIVLPFDEIARANPEYVDALYREYLRDPASVDERWALVFAGFDLALRDGSRHGGSIDELVHSYRELGHLVADLDPLGGSAREHPLLRLAELGFTERDLERIVDWAPFKGGTRGPLRELIAALRETYCGTLGVEYLSVADKVRREWLQERVEPRRNHPDLSADDSHKRQRLSPPVDRVNNRYGRCAIGLGLFPRRKGVQQPCRLSPGPGEVRGLA